MRRVFVVIACACGAHNPAPSIGNQGGGANQALELTVEASGDGHAAIVSNGGGATVMIHREIAVRDASGAPVDAVGLYLRATCDGDPPVCIALAPGATLRAVPWDDEIGDAQCECTKCGEAPAGAYTFTITRCDDGAPVTSAPFAVGGRRE